MTKKPKIAFFLLPEVHLLDLSGAVQVFYEAASFGKPYELIFCSTNSIQQSSAGLVLAQLVHFENLNLQKGDYLFIPGLENTNLDTALFTKLRAAYFFDWLVSQERNGITICSVCNGAFILAEAGLLNGRRCTSHWKGLQKMRTQYPKAIVQNDCIFTKDKGIYTSAGVTTGVDMALSILEEHHGTPFAAKVSLEMVVYMRRNGIHSQKSVYLDYRNHVHAGIHRVQDWLIENMVEKTTIEALAKLVNMSARNLTRIFRKVTGISINDFRRLLRLEKAHQLLQQTNLTIEHIAQQCGFENPRQFRRVFKKEKGVLPSTFRKELIG